MKWILVLVVLDFNASLEATEQGVFDSMEDCFWARDYLASERGGEDGFFPPNEQALCIPSDRYEINIRG